MSDIELIRRTITLYAMLLDDGRCEEWGDLFVENAEWVSNFGVYEKADGKTLFEASGRAEIIRIGEALTKQTASSGGNSMHFNAPALIDISGTIAKAWWNFSVLHTDKDGFEFRATGRIYAEFIKQDDIWRFTKRVNVRSGGMLPPRLATIPSH